MSREYWKSTPDKPFYLVKMDLIGKKIGKLTVSKFSHTKEYKSYFICQCECGIIKTFSAAGLVKDRYKSCGCDTLKEKINNIIGQRFGELTVISFSHKEGNFKYFLCRCDCGVEKTVAVYSLTRGLTKSCGKYKTGKESRCYKHGQYGTNLYNVWCGIRQRCHNANTKRYVDYGGRGIVVCIEWRNSFLSFYNWATENGWKKGLTIERINNNGNYEPSNCKWATLKEQMNNTRRSRKFSINGETFTLKQWVDRYGAKYGVVRSRIEKGMDIRIALTMGVACL